MLKPSAFISSMLYFNSTVVQLEEIAYYTTYRLYSISILL